MTIQVLPWEKPGWLDEVRAWIRAALQRGGLSLAGEIEQAHTRPWSTVLSVPTRQGLCYFKASAPALEYEAGLTAYLARRRADISPELIAVDVGRGWMLMRSSGETLRAWIKIERSPERWRAVLPLYAGLQKELASHIDQILTLGVLDRRLERLPALFQRLVADEPSMLLGQPGGMTADEYRRLRDAWRTFERLCAELAGSGIPATLHHDDFHDGNVFMKDGRVVFTDWGESAVAHPFFTLVVLLRGAENSLDLAPEAPELAQLRDWYLSQWTDYASLNELRNVAHLAQRVGLVNRALTWHRVIAGLPARLKPGYMAAIPAYLQDFINSE